MSRQNSFESGIPPMNVFHISLWFGWCFFGIHNIWPLASCPARLSNHSLNPFVSHHSPLHLPHRAAAAGIVPATCTWTWATRAIQNDGKRRRRNMYMDSTQHIRCTVLRRRRRKWWCATANGTHCTNNNNNNKQQQRLRQRQKVAASWEMPLKFVVLLICIFFHFL